MQIIHDFLTVNEYSRPGKKIKEIRAVVLHWTATPGQNAAEVRTFFENRKLGMSGYGSAHYIIDQNGIVIAAIPEYEVAYHCGTDQQDPASGKIYTDRARLILGAYASNSSSPNNCTLSIELCPVDMYGNFSKATINTAIELTADICRRYELTEKQIMTHKEVVGWKDCPALWSHKPELFEQFKKNIINII